MINEFEVDGVKYRYTGKGKVYLSKTAVSLIGISAMFGGGFSSQGFSIKGGISDNKLAELKQVDLIEEYFLIQKKKSKLSSNERKWVVRQFNRNFERIEP